ncbi:MAG: kynurenine 3-monooxygenase [Flavobacteriales bacterium]|nr:kynurenine 3-monooxygenase [Flavobacteriales bacterium]
MYLENKKISVVGGGLVGSLLATYLSKQGANVLVFDKRSDPRKDINQAGRSINLALSDRGIRALKTLGIKGQIMKIAMPMYKRIMHSNSGSLTEQRYGKSQQAIYSVSRHILNTKLIDIAEQHNVKFHFNKQCEEIDFSNNELLFKGDYVSHSDYIFAADGAGSVIRKKMGHCFADVKITEKFIDSSYKELTIPSHLDGTHKIQNDALHIWPRKSFMVIALPNLDGTFTCTLFAPNKGQSSFDEIKKNEDVKSFFSSYFPDLVNLIPDLAEQYFNNPTSPLGFVRCSSWKKNNTILLGDACHATVPFYGQGMNSGFEDCFLLNEWINLNHSLSNRTIKEFLSLRQLNTEAMQDLSMANFIEMQSKTADPGFLLQKKIEEWFSNKHPDKWMPLYSMVTFSSVSYHEAMQKGIIQDEIMKDVMSKNNLQIVFNEAELNEKNIEQQILSRIS